MANQNSDPNNDSNKFVGIPISELIKAPLEAVVESQKKLSQSAFEFMTEIGFDDEEKIRMIEFNLQKSIEGAPGSQDIKVQVPFLGLVPLPNLLIDDVQVDFQMEVIDNAISDDKSASEGSTAANANFKFDGFNGGYVNVSGKVVSASGNTDSANQTAKYKVNTSELNSDQLEGLTKLIELLTEHLESVPGEREEAKGSNYLLI